MIEGVNHSTVVRDLAHDAPPEPADEHESRADVVHDAPPKVKGRDGKQYPARRPPPLPPKISAERERRAARQREADEAQARADAIRQRNDWLDRACLTV